MLKAKVKYALIVSALLVLLLVVSWAMYSISTSGQAKGAVRVLEKQGEVNEEENKRALKASAVNSFILTESLESFHSRMLKYWASEDSGESGQTKGLQYTGQDASKNTKDGPSQGAEGQTSQALQDSDLLQGASAKLLPCTKIDLYSEDGSTLISTECVTDE